MEPTRTRKWLRSWRRFTGPQFRGGGHPAGAKEASHKETAGRYAAISLHAGRGIGPDLVPTPTWTMHHGCEHHLTKAEASHPTADQNVAQGIKELVNAGYYDLSDLAKST